MTRKLLLLFFLLSWTTITTFAQSFSTKGTDFWMGYMENNSSSPDLSLFISSDVATSGTVSIPQQGWSQTFTVGANATTQITVPTNQAHVTSTETVEGKGVHITSNDPVTAYALNYEPYSSDAAIILPTPTLGVEYYAATVDPINLNGATPSELMVVGVQNNTQIEITPSVATDGGNPAGVPFTTTLDAGEVFQVQANGGDLTGTEIKSQGNCNKFAVFAGAVCTNIGGCNYCDHLVEHRSTLMPGSFNRSTYPILPTLIRTSRSWSLNTVKDKIAMGPMRILSSQY